MLNSVAIDIGSYAVKVIQGKPGKKVAIERTIETPNTMGLSIPTDEGTADKLAEIINNIFTDNTLDRTDVRLSLPESLVSTKIISIPPLTDAELASAIQWQAEQHIPIPLEELSLEYQVIFRPEKKDKDAQMRVLLIGARKSIIEKYVDLFLRAGIEPTLLETQTISLFRSLQFTPADVTTLVVHVGAATTEMSIIDQGELCFVYTYSSAGQVFTRALEQSLQLDPKEAEQYKRTYGVLPDQLQGKLREILVPQLKIFLTEVQKAMQFFASQSPGQTVKRIILSGGSSQLPGFVEFITEQLGVEVLIASPFATAEGAIPTENQPSFSVCMGLMMNEM